MMIAGRAGQAVSADLGDHRADLGVHVTQRADQQRSLGGAARQAPGSRADLARLPVISCHTLRLLSAPNPWYVRDARSLGTGGVIGAVKWGRWWRQGGAGTRLARVYRRD